MTRTLDIRDLGLQPYRPVLELQKTLVEQRREDAIPDTLILVEHQPVYTLGRNAVAENIVLSPERLEARGIDVVHIGRGGDVTFHGPGQLVGYPITKLAGSGRRVLKYVEGLEQTLIDTLAEYGVSASLDPSNRGVWVGRDKIAAIGVRITRQVTMHGFALNVAVDLSYYGGIVPCGIRDKGVTSLDRLAPGTTVAGVKPRLIEHFRRVMGYDD